MSAPHRSHKPDLRAVGSREMNVCAPMRVADLLAEKLPEDQVAGLLPRKAVAVLFGDAQAGKTFLALELAACIALGREFAGMKVKQGAVLYIIAEGFGGFAKRLRALVSKHPDLPSAPLRVILQAVNLREWKEDLLIRARDVEEDAGPLGLVVIDTLSQTLWGDENSGQDMAEYIGAAGLLADLLGCPVLILHHKGKDDARGMRGSSALRGNVDVAINLKADADGNRVATTNPAAGGKSRDDEPVNLGFRLRAVPVGRNAEGLEVSSCVVEHQSADLANTARKPIIGAAQKLLKELAADLARASPRYRPDGTPLVLRSDLEAAWAMSKKATHRDKYASPSYMSKPLADLVAGGHLMQEGPDLWFPR